MRFISHDSHLMSFNLCLEVKGMMRFRADLDCRVRTPDLHSHRLDAALSNDAKSA